MLDAEVCDRARLARDARFDGRFFVAVKTTGIYCRPTCRARTPKRANVEFYETAIAAQAAGFRPCLLCRPECAPGSAAWRGTLSTVSRAMNLIDDGALDHGDVASLAERLGVGERHLRRLFDQHVGASPVEVAQTRRVLIAKQLLHETSLPMTAIADAAGFRSLRRFNHTFRTLFKKSPSAIRRDVKASSDANTTGVTLTLAYRPPYDAASLFRFLAGRQIEGVELIGDERYARTFDVNGVTGRLLVVHEPERNRFRATIETSRLSIIPIVIARLRRLFDLDADPMAIASALGEDPKLARIIAARPGMRVPGAFDPFELAVRAILGQQVTVAGATRLSGRLVRLFGKAVDGVDGLTHLFPAPSVLADVDVSVIGMPKSRAMTIRDLAREVANDPALFDASREPAEIRARLTAIRGIGDWTAHYISMRALGDTDAFPSGDLALQRALTRGDKRPNTREVEARSERWRPWRAYAAIYLWAAASSETKAKANDAIHPLTPAVADRPAHAGVV